MLVRGKRMTKRRRRIVVALAYDEIWTTVLMR
jgi:hypothetical protein